MIPVRDCANAITDAIHAASAISGIVGMLGGEPFPYAGTSEFDTVVRAAEKKVTTWEQVLAFVEQNSAEYLTGIVALTPEQINSTVTIPFGPMPMAVGITLLADHIRYQTA